MPCQNVLQERTLYTELVAPCRTFPPYFVLQSTYPFTVIAILGDYYEAEISHECRACTIAYPYRYMCFSAPRAIHATSYEP